MAANGKKFAILALVGILVVGAVVATVVTVTRKNGKGDSNSGGSGIKSNAKAIESVCQPTDHKDVCVQTLNSAAADVTDPQELVKIAFNIANKHLEESQKNFSNLMVALANDPKTAKPLEQCNELVQLAIRDLSRSAEKLGKFDLSNMNEILETMKIWLSASLTYEETCLDGFQNTSGDASQKMRDILKEAMDLTENTLGMVTEVAKALGSQSFGRRLLSNEGFPTWTSLSTRKLLAANPKDIKPDAIVAKDGSGKFNTIMAAIESIPKDRTTTSPPFVVRIKEGVYNEKVVVPKEAPNVVFIGDGPTKTKITGKLNVADGNMTTYHSASFSVMSDNFVARDMGFENTAGADKHQAVAARVSGDFAAFQNCRFDGYQDTLYTHCYRQYYRDCTVTGTIDFIFGDAAVVFQNCNLLVRKCEANQFNAVTAQGRKNAKMPTGTVLQNCTIKEDPENPPLKTTKSYLARPWKKFSRTIIMESEIGSAIDPVGYLGWWGEQFENSCFYAEYNNRGPMADKAQRAKWKGIHDIKKEVAEMFTAAKFLEGEKWIPATGIPYTPGFILPTPKDAPNAIGLGQAGSFQSNLAKEDYKEKKTAA